MKKKEFVNERFPHMIHGGDYNPEQWKNYPEIIAEDMRLIPLANCNAMTVGIFSWASLEPEEGVYNFQFLDDIMDQLYRIGVKVILATPSGARPAWMSQNHPEVLRVDENRIRILHGGRHNHCYTSPYYRKKIQELNRRLATRYSNYPALLLWHVSNEYGGECHCELCQNAFRSWLKERYDNNLDRLNEAYWTGFWGHTYTSWDQIVSPSIRGESEMHGLNLDWKRFVTHQTIDFMKNEIVPLRELTPDIPITTNFMGIYPGLDYFKFRDIVDVVSWDNYPAWHNGDNIGEAKKSAFIHDLNRSLKDKPFLMMESTPSTVNWMDVNKLKRPGMHLLSAVQAVAHGSDSVQYFQWRKSRGCAEKFHGAVVDHYGRENTRVFRDVAEVGENLKKLDDIVGTHTVAETAVIFDWENRWAVNDMAGMMRHNKKIDETCLSHYSAFWKKGVNVDVIDSECDFDKYRLVVAPMMYLIKPGVEDKIERFVKNGGTIVFTYCSGWVNETDLCYLGGFPGGKLKEIFGIRSEEIDSLYPKDSNIIAMKDEKKYRAIDFCELIHAESAEVLGTYTRDFYAGMPAVTCNNYGNGKAYYIAFRDDGEFLPDFYGQLIEELQLPRALETELPDGTTAHTRTDGEWIYLFLENYNDVKKEILLPGTYENMLTNEKVSGKILLEKYGCAILKSNSMRTNHHALP